MVSQNKKQKKEKEVGRHTIAKKLLSPIPFFPNVSNSFLLFLFLSPPFSSTTINSQVMGSLAIKTSRALAPLEPPPLHQQHNQESLKVTLAKPPRRRKRRAVHNAVKISASLVSSGSKVSMCAIVNENVF